MLLTQVQNLIRSKEVPQGRGAHYGLEETNGMVYVGFQQKAENARQGFGPCWALKRP